MPGSQAGSEMTNFVGDETASMSYLTHYSAVLSKTSTDLCYAHHEAPNSLHGVCSRCR